MHDIQKICQGYLQAIQGVTHLAALEDIRLKALGKSGEISLLMKSLGQMDAEERKAKGAEFNHAQQQITQALQAQKATLEAQELTARLQKEWVDVTLPPRQERLGHVHPISQGMAEAIDILKSMGFSVADGPDIESDKLNFDALNIPAHHPARQDQDTFYLPDQNGETMVLRTHTSPVQIRTMREKKPPLRIIAPGRVYRSDYDATHTPTFHQIEGLYVAKGLNMGHLKGCLVEFCRRFFGRDDLKVRFRPAYFPFTEPSAEVDIAWENGKWLEILGAGMVHPNVLRNGGVDPSEFSGFAFGLGIERFSMIKYGIEDLRAFYVPDFRWLAHYGFRATDDLNVGGVSS